MLEWIIEFGVLLTFLLLLTHAKIHRRLSFVSIVLVNALILEVHAYVLYGQVAYASFYLTFLNIPLWVLVGWVIPLYVLTGLMGSLRMLNVPGKIALLSLSMLCIDLVLEPLAYFFHLWAWKSGEIYYLPNLFAWVLFSLLVGYFFLYSRDAPLGNLLKHSFFLQILGISLGFVWFHLPLKVSTVLFFVLIGVLIFVLVRSMKKKSLLR